MLFNSFIFWPFFAAVFALVLVLPHRAQNRMLLVASYIFYGAWDWRFLGLILLSTLVDYFVGLRMARSTVDAERRRLLMLSLGTNLGLLGVFKYFGFFVETFTAMMAGIGFDVDPLVVSIILPVGISFYTFQTLSYTIDIYRRELEPARDFLDFALFVAFFPQLVAGPIERAKNLLPNITNPRRITMDGIGRGAVLCLVELIKKVVIADGLAPSVDAVFAADAPTGAEVAIAVFFFAIQIYCDFSRYTDIARGTAKILGFDLMRNFAQPYFAADPQEFWRRWHISLSTWLRDYLYVSLGGNRKGRGRTYVNLMATMTLGGLWHGAAWNFVLWGIYQGTLLVVHRAISGRHKRTGEAQLTSFGAIIRRVGAVVLFFPLVCYGWLLFRAESFEQIVQMSGALLTLSPAQFVAPAVPTPPFATLLGILALFLWDLSLEHSGKPQFYLRLPLVLRGGLYATMIYLLAFGATTAPSSFIYFQF
jgi:D-alanyl-lipoteichoic acid acyltransferase DltB (MBOAT superfamily)